MSIKTFLLLFYCLITWSGAQTTNNCGEYGFRCINLHEYVMCPINDEENSTANIEISRSCTENMTCDEENPSFCSPSSSEDECGKVMKRDLSDKIESEYVYSEGSNDDYGENFHVHDEINLNFFDEDEEEMSLETTTAAMDDEFCKKLDQDILKVFSNPHDCQRIGYFPGNFMKN